MRIEHINGVKTLLLPAEGELLGSPQSALDVMGETYGQDIDMIAIPAARFDPDFFRLRTRMAGEFIQKLQNYRLRLAILGDISPFIAQSDALRDFVYETNKSGHHLFVGDEQDLAVKVKGV